MFVDIVEPQERARVGDREGKGGVREGEHAKLSELLNRSRMTRWVCGSQTRNGVKQTRSEG